MSMKTCRPCPWNCLKINALDWWISQDVRRSAETYECCFIKLSSSNFPKTPKRRKLSERPYNRQKIHLVVRNCIVLISLHYYFSRPKLNWFKSLDVVTVEIIKRTTTDLQCTLKGTHLVWLVWLQFDEDSQIKQTLWPSKFGFHISSLKIPKTDADGKTVIGTYRVATIPLVLDGRNAHAVEQKLLKICKN